MWWPDKCNCCPETSASGPSQRTASALCWCPWKNWEQEEPKNLVSLIVYGTKNENVDNKLFCVVLVFIESTHGFY